MSELFSFKGKEICVKLFIVGNSFITQGWFKVSFHRRLNSWWKWKCSSLSHVRLFSTLWTLACQAPLTMGFSRQEYWSGLPCPPPGGLPDSGIEPHLFCISRRFFTTSAPWEARKATDFSVTNSFFLLCPLSQDSFFPQENNPINSPFSKIYNQ